MPALDTKILARTLPSSLARQAKQRFRFVHLSPKTATGTGALGAPGSLEASISGSRVTFGEDKRCWWKILVTRRRRIAGWTATATGGKTHHTSTGPRGTGMLSRAAEAGSSMNEAVSGAGRY